MPRRITTIHRHAALVRTFAVMRELAAGVEGIAGVDELARRLHVTRRTVYRDLEALEAAGLPLLRERGRCTLLRGQCPLCGRGGASEPKGKHVARPGSGPARSRRRRK